MVNGVEHPISVNLDYNEIYITDGYTQQTYTVSLQTNAFVLIPYKYSENLEGPVRYNPTRFQILNNQQFTTMKNNGYEQGYTDGYSDGETVGYNQGEASGYTNGYSTGYTAGETAGYNTGYAAGYTDGMEDTQESAYRQGYAAGYAKGAQDTADIGEGGARLITAVVEAPVNVYTSMLNFEILGVNVLGFVTACLSICLVFAIIKKVL